MAPPKIVTLSTSDLIARLANVERELEAVGDAPRVEMDTAALRALVSLSLRALTALYDGVKKS